MVWQFGNKNKMFQTLNPKYNDLKFPFLQIKNKNNQFLVMNSNEIKIQIFLKV